MTDLSNELARLAAMPAAKLRAEWRRWFRGEPPTSFSRDLILRAIAHHLQEQQLGGLAPSQRQRLDGLAQGKSEPVRQLKVGTMLVREYQGVLHEVAVVPDGFHWQDSTYASLSTIARAITGTAWNGPRFFGLRARSKDGSADKGEPAPQPEPTPQRPSRRGAVRSSPVIAVEKPALPTTAMQSRSR